MKLRIDGETINMAEFLACNDFSYEEIAGFENMKIGEKINYGGGAAASFLIQRIA